MRNRILNFYNLLLKKLARAVIQKYHPRVIGITGVVGKTSSKNAIYTVLKNAGLKVRAAGGNLNNETGLPLAILGDYKKSGGIFFLTGAFLAGIWTLLSPWGRRRYPTVLILEYSADKPGDLDYLLQIVKPDIGIVTSIGETPVHIEFYKNREELIEEKGKLVGAIGDTGTVILNADDPDVLKMKNETGAHLKTYGFSEMADIKLEGFQNVAKDGVLVGVRCGIRAGSEKSQIYLQDVLGKSQAYAIGSAVAVGVIVGLGLSEIAEAISTYEGEKGRTKIIPAIKGAYIIDDTYNASPSSTENALDILESIKAKRKIAVLGDMLELGEYSEEAHTQIGELTSQVADVLITVGPAGRNIVKRAIEGGISEDKTFSFQTSEEAGNKLKKIISEGDLVLIKGSQSMRMEKAVKKVMQEPKNASKLLVRQYGKWLRG